MQSNEKRKVLLTGGAGYVGSVLVPKLLKAGHFVKVIDLYMFGDDVLTSVNNHPNLIQIKGDIRDKSLLEKELAGLDTVIHLACISNDPSFDLDPKLGRSVNYDAFLTLIQAAKLNRINRFIYASSSSVYGVKQDQNVTEELPLEPLTDYSKYKALCEKALQEAREPGFLTLILRPATVCGYSPRLRLDLTVNILTNHAINNHKITVFGGNQMRPNIHIDDMTDLYVQALAWPDKDIDGECFNVGYQNFPVLKIAEIVRQTLGNNIDISITETDDNRSYHISAEKIKRKLGFVPRRTVEDAVSDLKAAFDAGLIPDAMTDSRYYNIRKMQELAIK